MFCGGSAHDPQSPIDAVRNCGDQRRYNGALAIASTKTPQAIQTRESRSPRSSDEKAVAIVGERAHASQCFLAKGRCRMTIRSRREVITFKHPFRIRGIDRLLPEGAYEVVTDEETIEGLSFAAYRRVATMIVVPVEGSRGAAVEMLSIGSVDLADAQRIDASASDD
jgi:hypothetical protein